MVAVVGLDVDVPGDRFRELLAVSPAIVASASFASSSVGSASASASSTSSSAAESAACAARRRALQGGSGCRRRGRAEARRSRPRRTAGRNHRRASARARASSAAWTGASHRRRSGVSAERVRDSAHQRSASGDIRGAFRRAEGVLRQYVGGERRLTHEQPVAEDAVGRVEHCQCRGSGRVRLRQHRADHAVELSPPVVARETMTTVASNARTALTPSSSNLRPL